ncbi:MAG: XRE family transcriptional regulator [Marivivens sp.]|jgi:plasmid maintenance system antidote protein VapI|nr:XRE family transcriptional regulator [Marivivens sp.]
MSVLLMADTARRPTFDVDRLRDDMALRGWLPVDLARAAGVADMTVYRFLARDAQTPKTAKKLADALGYSVRRYLVSAKAVA